MDARNAAESSSTKQPASPKEGDTGRDALKSKPTSSTTTDTIRSPTNNKPPSLVPDSLSAISSSHTLDENAASDQNSDAETIVLPGKDGVSPSKPRKVIKHEDKSDEEMNGIPRPKKPWTDARNADRNGAHSDNLTVKKKRPTERERKTDPLGSVPTSPPNNKHRNNGSHRRRKSGDIQSESGSESSRSRSQEPSRKDKAKLIERRPPFKRKSVKVESDDDGEMRKGRRPRISDTSIDTPAGGRERDQRPTSGRQAEKPSTTRNRSTSPPSRIHRRSLSTQHPSHSSDGIGSKKRRVPAPLQSTDYQSDDSSASGSPHPRGSKLRSVATPITGESTISPARIPGHRKHVDNHGQTLLAKACAKGEYEIAKKRLSERPEDLNFADYAGNTPLQIASLHGHEDIVQLLIEAGCNLDCRNGDKETPLLDAVENGHLEVVKLLLKAGVNPRKADAAGHEPLEKVPDDLDNAEEIRAALREAKERAGELRRTSEDHQPHDLPDTYSSHGPDSPRESPAAHTGSNLAEKRRGGTVRSTKTSNHLLYMNLDDKTLRQAAARGDHETVTRVLQVKERCDDPEALVNAARGGHALVVELLLALGSATPDPRPVASLPPEYNTPILAAIGQENLDVIKLLVNANGFNPTRLSKGLTYYEIARRREGPNWKDEEHILKTAFDDFKKGTKGSSRPKSSPSRREREQESESKRATRNDLGSDASRGQKRLQRCTV
ncbi:ankyrin [Poronia punctata]|nr:ankyrin [Poronia punctata]